MKAKDQELDLRNLDIITEVSTKGGKINDGLEHESKLILAKALLDCRLIELTA